MHQMAAIFSCPLNFVARLLSFRPMDRAAPLSVMTQPKMAPVNRVKK